MRLPSAGQRVPGRCSVGMCSLSAPKKLRALRSRFLPNSSHGSTAMQWYPPYHMKPCLIWWRPCVTWNLNSLSPLPKSCIRQSRQQSSVLRSGSRLLDQNSMPTGSKDWAISSKVRHTHPNQQVRTHLSIARHRLAIGYGKEKS